MNLDVEKIIDYLENHIGENTTSYLLVTKTSAYEGDNFENENKFEMEKQICDIAERNGFYLNKEHHGDADIGLPWNIDFVIERRDEKISNEILSEELITYRLYRIEEEYGIFNENEEIIGFKTNIPWKVKKTYDEDKLYIKENRKKGIIID